GGGGVGRDCGGELRVVRWRCTDVEPVPSLPARTCRRGRHTLLAVPLVPGPTHTLGAVPILPATTCLRGRHTLIAVPLGPGPTHTLGAVPILPATTCRRGRQTLLAFPLGPRPTQTLAAVPMLPARTRGLHTPLASPYEHGAAARA